MGKLLPTNPKATSRVYIVRLYPTPTPKANGESYLYDYDNNGNILTKRTMPFTLKTKEEIEELSCLYVKCCGIEK